MQFDIPEAEKKQAKHPHEYFLVNLITNHILLFIGVLGMAKQEPWALLIIPGISITILTYLVWRARLSSKKDSWYVFCHWQLCARRSYFFIAMLSLMALGIVAILSSVGGDVQALKPGHYAIGGVIIFPTLLSVLALILMESDAVHKAASGIVPDWLVKKFPPPESFS